MHTPRPRRPAPLTLALLLAAGLIGPAGGQAQVLSPNLAFIALDPCRLGNNNTATGVDALGANTSGPNNTATGVLALAANIGGGDNTATGFQALRSNLSAANTATGSSALLSNTTGMFNTAMGRSALASNTTGGQNTAIGTRALGDNTTGFSNIALGDQAGVNATTGGNNIYIANVGVAAEAATTRIGAAQARTFIAGIRGKTTGVADAIAVLIDSEGQLGTVNSSRRVKEEIHPMGEGSRGLLRLRPVTFRYRQAAADGARPRQYGLIAEEVAEVYPELVAYTAEGEAETVLYHLLPAMLLNELQALHRALAAKSQALDELRQRLEALEARVRPLR